MRFGSLRNACQGFGSNTTARRYETLLASEMKHSDVGFLGPSGSRPGRICGIHSGRKATFLPGASYFPMLSGHRRPPGEMHAIS